MPDNLTDREKCRFIANYFAENIEYFTEERAQRYFADEGSLTGYIYVGIPAEVFTTPYGALMNGKANCEGYSRAFAALANQAGIKCVYVFGKTNDGYHAWNMVELDGEWAHIDTTWIDGKRGFNEDYFLVSDEQISKTHTAISYADCDFVPLPAAQ